MLRVQDIMKSSAPFAFENGLTVCRTEDTIISDIDNGDVSRFKRNIEYRGTGYSSPANLPYHTFGSMLEVDRLSRYVVPKTRPTSQGKQNIEAGWTTPLSMNNLTPRPIKVQRMSTCKYIPPPSINAGLSSINVGVCASDWGKREVHAGSCIVEMITRQKERKNFLHGCQKAMLYKKLKPFNKSHTPSVYLNGLSVQNSYKGSLVARNINAALFNESQQKVPVPPAGLESPGRDVEKDAAKSAERRKSIFPNLMAALAAANFKHRTVKQDFEMKLRAELLECQRNYLSSLEIIYYILCVLHNMKTKDLKSKAPLSNQALKKLSQKPRYYAGGLTSESLDVTRIRNRSKSSSASKMMRGAVTTPATTPLYLFRESNIGTGSTTQGRESHLKDTWPRPPWQRPIIFMNASEEENDPKVKIDACCQQFRQVKDELSYKLFKKMLDCDKNHDSRMIDKLESLTFGFTYIDELIELRERGPLPLKRNKTKTPIGKLRKPEWFLLLEQKTDSLLEHPLLTKKGAAIMNKLELFIALDVTENSNIMEKLCLLTFSIPLYKVCTPSYVKAIKFVLQHILQVKPDLFNQWMEIRKLPIIDTD